VVIGLTIRVPDVGRVTPVVPVAVRVMPYAPEVVSEPPDAAVAGLIQLIVLTSLDGALNAIVCPAVGTEFG
jgi:hypothetical protein